MLSSGEVTLHVRGLQIQIQQAWAKIPDSVTIGHWALIYLLAFSDELFTLISVTSIKTRPTLSPLVFILKYLAHDKQAVGVQKLNVMNLMV